MSELPTREYSVWVRHNGEMTMFTSTNTEEFALELIISQARQFGEPGARYEVRNSNGKVVHRIDIEMIYTVNPKEEGASDE